MKSIVIMGAGGLGREAAWVVERINRLAITFRLLGFCDDDAGKKSGAIGPHALLGTLEEAASRFGAIGFFCAIGDNRIRKNVTARARSAGLEPVSLVDPSAVIAPGVSLGEGCYVGINSILSVGAQLGESVIVNHHATIGHDVRLAAFAQVCPGVCVSGGCEVGEGALLGTHAGMIPGKKMGAWSVLGAGTMALRDIPDTATVVRLGAR